MRLGNQRRSVNVEDRRGVRMGRGIAGGGVGVVIVALVAMLLGVDPGVVLQGLTEAPTTSKPAAPGESDPARDFVAAVLGSTEDTWAPIFQQSGIRYDKPTLVLFSGVVQSACGYAQAAVGPFYCPADRMLYIDLAFFRDLQARLQAPGDFAQAYVIAHEVGHHVQNLLGVMDRARGPRADRGNEASIRTELQADCYAGVWASHNPAILEAGDIEEGLAAAAAVGDDRIQMQSQGYVSPESFTHGSAAQRVRWFRAGLESGNPNRCDTFAAARL